MTRDEAYGVLSDLIFRGFLTTELVLNGKSFVFKTVNEREFSLMKAYAGHPDRPDYLVRFNTLFLVHSLFLVDGESILFERRNKLSELCEHFMTMSDTLFKKFFTEMNAVRSESFDVLKYLEGFSYTDHSRRSWKVMCGGVPNDEAFTGIAGTKEMGLNAHQESWIQINRMLDDEAQYNREFSNALLIASASNPKGTRKIRSQHDANLQSSEDRRKQLAEIGYRETEGRWSPEGWAAPVDTVEELLGELNRQMNGVKDRHDLFIEGYLKSLKEEAEKNAKEAEDRMLAARGDAPAGITSTQRAVTPEEMREILRKRSTSLVSVQSEDVASPEDKDKFLTKVGAKVLTSRN